MMYPGIERDSEKIDRLDREIREIRQKTFTVSQRQDIFPFLIIAIGLIGLVLAIHLSKTMPPVKP